MTRKEQAALSRQKLIDTALQLITEKGYHNTSIFDITSACGMSTGNFYHYFKSKEDIISKLEREPFDQLTKDMDIHRNLPVIDQFRIYLDNRLTLGLQYGIHFNQQWYTYHMENPVTDPGCDNKMDKDRNDVRLILSNGISNGELLPEIPADSIALHATLELHGATMYYIMTKEAFDMRQWAAEYCQIMERILRPYYTNKKE